MSKRIHEPCNPQSGRSRREFLSLASKALAYGALASACVHSFPVPSRPEPSQVTASAPRGVDWSAASIIRASRDFAVWEPMLSELAGEAPLPHERVHIVPAERAAQVCLGGLGCNYERDCASSTWHGRIEIYINERTEVEVIDAEEKITGLLGSRGTYSYPRSRLSAYVHEQAHFYGRHILRASSRSRSTISERKENWDCELEAEAFVLYFAQHLAENYDMETGRMILRNILYAIRLRSTDFEGGLSSMDSGAESFNPLCLAHGSIAALLGSQMFRSYGALWHFLATSPQAEVEGLVRANAGNIERGLDIGYGLIPSSGA